MKIGITLPQFRDGAGEAVDAARAAESLALDGVFCFDHLWPQGRPDRPALSVFPLLGAVAASTDAITVGTLVARVGLVADQVLVAALRAASVISGGRLIAGLGTGDGKNRAENEAFGIPFESAAVRRQRMETVAGQLRHLGIPVWIGGGQPETVAVARRIGAAVNRWDPDPTRIGGPEDAGVEVTWGGPVGRTEAEVVRTLTTVAGTGATWAVCAWPHSLEAVAAAADTVRSLPVSEPGGQRQ